jgi:hypothetical protein
MLIRDAVLRRPHIKEHTPIFQHSGLREPGEKVLDGIRHHLRRLFFKRFASPAG